MNTIESKGFAVVVGACFIATVTVLSMGATGAGKAVEIRRAAPITVVARRDASLSVRRADTLVVTARRLDATVASAPAGRSGVARDPALF